MGLDQNVIEQSSTVLIQLKACELGSPRMPAFKADSHTACRAHAVPLPCRALIHTCHAAPLPCSNSAVSFVKVRVVAENIRTASPAV